MVAQNGKYSTPWKSNSEEARLRCRANEWHETRAGGTRLVQCTQDRRTEHVHAWRGVPFKNQDQ